MLECEEAANEIDGVLDERCVLQFAAQHCCGSCAAVLGRGACKRGRLVEDAIDLVSGLFAFEHVTLTPNQARDVLRKEKAAGEPPVRPGPTYHDLIEGAVSCEECRRKRGGADASISTTTNSMMTRISGPPPSDMPPERWRRKSSRPSFAASRSKEWRTFVAGAPRAGAPRIRNSRS